jgi:aminoglycoside phosphotransferase (APT) family kinase protein
MPVDETIAIRAGEEFDVPKVEAYLRSQLTELGAGALEVRQFPSGASNLTYLLQVGAWEGVLRRPPLGPIPPKAHDMERESGLLRQVHPVFPLAPRPYLFCNDLAVLGVPFYVMERRRGVVVNQSFPPGFAPDADFCGRLSRMMVQTLVGIHTIDYQAAGLAEFGYPEGFTARQVKRFIEAYGRAQTDEIAQMEPLMRWLAEHVPAGGGAALIHNDFKLNNMLLDEHDLSRATAVLDWEMATIGDPLLDLAITLGYWVEAGDPEDLRNILPAVTTLPGFFSRAQFMDLYAEQTGRDLSGMHFYLTFAYFKLVVILQQIYARWRRGQTQDERFGYFGSRIQSLVNHAARLAEAGKL